MIEPYKKKAVDRLKRARGQIDGIIKMIEEDKYCIDIITQSLALQGAMKATSRLILESHLNTCGEKSFKSKDPKKREKFIAEITKAFELLGR